MVYMGMGGGVEQSCVRVYTHTHIYVYIHIYIYIPYMYRGIYRPCEDVEGFGSTVSYGCMLAG